MGDYWIRHGYGKRGVFLGGARWGVGKLFVFGRWRVLKGVVDSLKLGRRLCIERQSFINPTF